MDTGPKQRRSMNPRYKANLFSILTFGWTLDTFKLGYSRDIKDGDLYAPLPEHRSDILGNAMQEAWERERESARRRGDDSPSLWRVLFKVFGLELMLYGLILAAMEFLIRLQQPLFLGLLLRYYSPTQDANTNTTSSTYLSRLFAYYDMDSSISWGEAVFFAFGIIICSTVNVMVQHPFMMGVMHMGMKMRVGVCSLIYRKALKVSLQDMSENSAGLVVNLMANDVNRFDTGPLFAHYLWIGPFETMLTTVYLYREMGISALYGSLIIIALIPFQTLPTSGPILKADKDRYQPGEVLEANCTSPPARPAINLTIYINDDPLRSSETSLHPSESGLLWTTVRAEVKVTPELFQGGRLRVACVATVYDVYKDSANLDFFTPETDPRPERITLNRGSSKSFPTWILLLLLFLLPMVVMGQDYPYFTDYEDTPYNDEKTYNDALLSLVG